MSELITLQIGSYANYVGAHYWNLQDEAIGCTQLQDWSSVAATFNSDVVCSWSEDRFGDSSYRPRAVVLDLSGSLGGVTFSPDAGAHGAAAAATAAAAGIWAGAVEMHTLGRAAKSKYRQQLEAADADLNDPDQLEAQQQALEAAAADLHTTQHMPRSWTDFLQVDLDHSSVLTLPGVWQGQPGWEGWGASSSSSSASREVVEAAMDRVRWWAEQSDAIQGLQLFAEDLGGWGGITHSLLQELRDQYPSQPVLYFSVRQQQQQPAGGTGLMDLSPQTLRHLLGHSLSLAEMPQLASLYIPLAADSHAAAATPGAASKFQTAALLAAAIDTATLPLRCTGSSSVAGAALGATDLHSLIHLLSGPAANLAALSLQMPVGLIPGGSTTSSPASHIGTPGPQQQQQQQQPPGAAAASSTRAPWLSLNDGGNCILSPAVQLSPERCMAESLTLRGARISAASLCSTSQAKQALDSLLLQRQQQTFAMRCVAHSCISPLPVPMPLSFPRSLAPAVADSPSGTQPEASSFNPYLARSSKAPAVPAPGALTRLTATSSYERVLQDAARNLLRLGAFAAGRACLEAWGYSGSDVEELREVLLEMAGKYSPEFEGL